MKEVWLICLLFANLIIKLNCQDDDYDTEPDEVVNADYAAPNEPEFFKNAFVENAQPAGRSGPGAGQMWGNYLQVMPFGPPPPLYSLPTAAQSMNYGTRSSGFGSKSFANEDFFADFDKSPGGRSKDSFDESPSPFNKPKSMRQTGYAGGYSQPPIFNYGTLAGAPYVPSYGQRFNPLYGGAPHQPVGAHLFPHAQRNKQNDNFDNELKEMGIDLTEFGLGGGSVEEEKKKKGKEKKKRKEKPSKVRPLFPSFLSPIKPTSTEAPPVVTPNQYLKSHVENDILNFGVNMHDFGIKEHKLEKQVYGDNRYQYPMQANVGSLSGYGQTGNQMGNQMGGQMGNPNAGYRGAGELSANGEIDFKGLNQQINQYSDNKINSLLKLNPAADQTTAGMLPVLNSNYNPLSPSLPVFTAIDANPLNNMNANDIAAINLLESGISDLDSFTGKAHEYRTHDQNSMHEKGRNHAPPDNINENFKTFVPPGASSKGEQRPKFLEDEFFKEKKPKKDEEEEDDNDKYDSEPRKTRGRKVVYKLNSDVKSNKYFESVAPKSKTSSYDEKNGSSDDYEDKYGKDQETRSNGKEEEEKYSQEEKYGKEDESSKPKYSDDQSSSYKTTAYSKEFGKPSTGAKYKFGYRYYGLNHQTGDNKKGETMKLVTGKDGEEAGDKPGHSDDSDQSRSNGGAEEEKGDEKTDDKATNETEDSKDDANESPSSKDDHLSGSNNSSSNANEEGGSNEEDKVEEDFSGSRRYAKRSVTTSDYFRPYRTNSKMAGSLGRANDKSLKMSSISRMNDKLMASSCSYCNRRALQREDHLDHEFGDSEEEPSYLSHPYAHKRRAIALERRRRLGRPVSLERRKKIVSFDDPPDSYAKRNFDTAASHKEEDFDFGYDRRSSSRAGRMRNRTASRSLKEEYDEAFGLKPVRSRAPGLGFAPRLERRKCGSNSARFKKTHRVYGGRDDTDFYSGLWKNPMYKKYQYLK